MYSDAAYLIRQLREGRPELPKHNAEVYTYGERPQKTGPEPDSHRVNCVYFDELDVLPEMPRFFIQQSAASANVGPKHFPALRLPRQGTLMRPFDQATVDALATAIHYSPVLEDGYRDLAPFGEFLWQFAHEDPRYYGFNKLKDLVLFMRIVDIKCPMLVRLKENVAVEIKPLSAWTVTDADKE
ncbi:hypothetical protein LTR17_003387 [Elasticomyces elasticus]|nr:hypothetical protein LTR17_003387 [Elasticomyces elasticus]